MATMLRYGVLLLALAILPSAAGSSAPVVEHPYGVAAGPAGVAFVADGTSGRILRLDLRSGRLTVHARGLTEPSGVAYGGGSVYVADFGAGLVRRVGGGGKLTTLARLPQVASVAVVGATVYAVSFDGTLARIAGGRVERVRVKGGLARPHGVTATRNGALLVTEDGKRVSRVNPRTGVKTLAFGGGDSHRVAVAADGTLYVAGGTVDRGRLRRVGPDGKARTLIDDLHVGDVAVVGPNTLLVSAVEPGSLWRVDARTGARTRLGA
jgi:sugar lactone lactonase YvrE